MRIDKEKVLAFFILAVAGLLFISPILSNLGYIGSGDWDQHIFLQAVPRKIIAAYHQFPLWNPYYCGGSAMLASPESTFLSPQFLLILLFGEVIGIKLVILLYAVLGLFGMYFLSRELGLGRVSSYLPPVIFIFSSWYALRVTEGHTVFFPMALMPFVAAFYIRSFKDGAYLRSIIFASLFLLLIFLAGGVYPAVLTGLFLAVYGILSAISGRTLKPISAFVLIAVFTFLLGAVKALPVLEFMKEFPRKTEDRQYHSAEILKDALFSRNQGVLSQHESFYITPDTDKGEYMKGFWSGARPWGWHEYGAFIGIAAAIVYLVGFTAFRATWIWIFISLMALLASLGEASPVNIWALLHKFPVLSSLHGPSRMAALFVFALAIVSGFGLSRLEERGGVKGRVAALIILIIVVLELITVSRPVLKDAFTEPATQLKENAQFSQIIVSDPTRVQYANLLTNTGTVNCYESMHPPIKAVPMGDDLGRLNPYYKGEVFLESGNGTASLLSFSPNKIVAEIDAVQSDRVILNQNFFKGWKVATDKAVEAYPVNGLVAGDVPAGKRQVTFYYCPLSFKAGLAVSVVSFLVLVVFLVRSRKRLASSKELRDV